MAKPTPKPTMKNGAVSDAAKVVKPTFSPAEVAKFKAVKTGAELLKMNDAQVKKYMMWQAQRSTATAKRITKKQYGW